MKTPLPFRITVRSIGFFAALFLAANLTMGQVQINEGFEGLIFPSTGWVESGNGDWSKQSAAAGYPVHSGSFAAYCNGAGSYLVTPAITINPADILTFWYRVESNSVPQDMDVLISTNPLLFTDTLFSLNGATNITYTKANIPLAAYNGQTVYIAFVGQTGGGAIFDYGILLDDILLFGLPVCANPVSPANGASNVAITAGLSWSAASAADGYMLNFGTNYPPDNIENGTDLGTGLAYNPAMLNYSTTYYWQVVPYNVNGSPSCGIWSFTTGVDPVIHTFPWTEPFSAWPPAGWDLSGGSLSWAPYGSTAAYCNFWNWPVGNALMTTPALDLSQDATLKFAWSHAYLPGFSDQFEVQISESGSGTWTTLWSIAGAAFHSNDGATNIAPGTYKQESVLIPVAYTGKTVNIRFLGTSGNGNDLFLDQVSVEFDPFLTVSAEDIFVCYGTAGTLDAIARGGQKPYQYAWTPASGLGDPTAGSTSATPAGTTQYTVDVTDALGNTATASATATVNPLLSVTAKYNTTVCTNNLTQLYAEVSGGTPPYTYSWDHGTTLSNSSVADPFSFANTTLTYTVTVTDAEGCQAFGQVTVTTTSQASATIFPVDPEICAGESILLTATGGVTYSWTSIPAGFTSSAASVSVSPASTRQYVVQTGSSCGNKRDTITVTVHPLPAVSFGAVAPVCVDASPFALTTGNPSGGFYAGPGVSGGIFDPSIAGSGNHVLSYTFTDGNGCTNSATTVATVNPLPVVNFTGLNTDYCVSAAPSALFGLPAGGTFNGPGILPGDLFDPAVAGAGTHVIMYAYTDANGCTNYTTKGVTVHPLPVLSIIGLNSSYCLIDPVETIYGSEAPFGSFSGPGIIDLGNGTAQFNPVMAWIGTHTITYTYTDGNGCSNAVSQTVSVFPLPNVSFSGLALSYCGNAAPVTLTGNQAPFGTFTGHGITDLGNGTATFDPAVAVTYPAFLNRHEIKYSYTSPNGCTNVASIFVTVHYVPTVNAGADQTICLGNVAQLNAIPGGGTPPYSYAWNNASSLSNALIRNPIASPLVTTTYTVTITDFNGCQNSDNLTITVNDPVATVVDDTTCLNTPIALNVVPSGGSAPYTFIWSPAASLNNPFIQNPIASPLSVGNHVYSVTITDAIGCFGSASLTLTVLPIPQVYSVTGGGAYCAGGSGVPVGLSGSESGISYELFLDGAATGNVVSGTGSAISFGNILVAGNYTVLATHPNGCTLDMTGAVQVIVNPNPTSSILTGDTCICNGTAANLFVAITGGLSPYTLTIFDGISNFVINAYVSGTPIVVNPLVTTTYTLVDVVDANGCTSQGISGTATVSIDLTAPTFTVPADITLYTDANCSYSLAVSVTGDVTDEADNCTPVLDATFSDVSVAGCEGTEVVTRTWTLVDNCGNSLVQTQLITVLDTTAPTFTVPADITLYTDANCSYSLAVAVTGDVTDEDDNCTTVLDATYTDVSVAGCEGTEVVTRTWTLLDACGNSLVQTQVITVLDTTPPTFTVPADITLYTDANCSYNATPAVTGDVTDEDDNCTTVLDATFSDVVVPGSCTGTYDITRTWTLVDDCGNNLVQTQLITVLDTTPPTFTVPADITLYTDANCSYSLAVAVTGDVTDEADNCTPVLDATFSDVNVPGCEGTEVVTRTWTLVDDCGNTLVQTQVITVLDTTPPTFTVPIDITLYTDANCSYSLAVAVTGDVTDEDDNCTTVLDATYSDVSVPGCEGTEVVTRTWTLVDDCGNSLVQTQIITVLDTTAPTFTVPADITLYTDANCSYSLAVAVTGDVTDEDDNCTTVLDATYTDVSVAGCEGTEVVTRTWTLVDACGNSLVQTQVITVLDTTPPTFTVPADITLYTDANCSYNATPAVTGDVTDEDDNCTTVLDATFSDVVVPGSCTGTYDITRTWTLVDDCGNSLVQTQLITVLDTTPPTFTVPADITLYTDANCSYSLAVSVTGDVTDEADNCTPVLDATFSDVSVPGCEGTEVVTRTWTLVDDCGNSLVQTQVITVLDTTPPTFTVPADITLYTDANCSYSLSVAVTGDVTDEDDNCTTVLDATYSDVSVPGCEGTEVVTRTWTLVDNCGNSLVQTQVITVLDTTPPTFTVPADVTIYTDANCVYNALPAVTGDVTDEDDNCTTVLNATYADVTAAGSCIGSFIITRTWTLVDACGNSLVQTQVITVEDNTPPTFTVPADITIYSDATCSYSTATAVTGDVTDEADNCTPVLDATFSDFTVPGSCLGSFIVTRTWTLVDDCGNSIVQTQVITVLDTLDPVFTFCPANVTINCVNADTSTANLGFPTYTDNCSPLPDIDIVYNDVVLSYVCPGEYSFARTFTITDDCGNSSSCTQVVTVVDTIVVSCPANMVVCADDPSFALTGATPLGGTYTGPGVAGNVFDPAIAGPGVHTITYTYTVDFCCVHTCTFSITVNPNPAAFNVTGGGAFCSGGLGVVVFLDGSEIGILYQLYNNGVATGPLVGGTGAQITFGYQNIAGTYTVIATNPVSGCTKLMTGNATVVVHPLPVAYNVTGGGAYCAGGAGIEVGLDGSENGVNYELHLYGASTGQVIAGNGGLITFGPQLLAGNYTVHALNASTLCESWMTGAVSVIINPNPVVFNVTGGGNYCTGGPGVNVGLSYSELGISYELIHNGSNTGIVLTGTGSALDFGPQSTAGAYTVFATNTTTLCSALMNGSASVTINPLPLPYAVTGGGSYCSGGTGVLVGLANSQNGTSYELYLDGIGTGDTMLGNGSAISFGPQIATGTYTVVATIISTGCTNNMLGSVTVTLYAVPMVYNVTGGGSYCAGGTGVVIGLDGSEAGVDYELWLNGVATSVIISGTGSPVSFPLQTAAGLYTVQATGVVTGCVSVMTSSATISIDPLPVSFTVTGGGSYCAGGTGLPVGLSGSEAGVTYALWLNGAATGQLVGGTGAAINFGDQTAAGTYTVAGTNAATGCISNMSGNAVVVIDPLPFAFTVTGGGVICSGGAGMNVGLSGSTVGILYELQLDGINTGTLLGGTGSSLNFGPQTTAGIYTIVATDPITGCTNTMNGSVSLVVNPLPAAFTVTGGGAYCVGGTAPEVGLSGSETGITYELYRDGTGTGQFLGGTGMALNFGIQTMTGTYTVMAVNTTTNCTSVMTGSVTVTMNILPVAFSVTGGGPYCQNSGGIAIGLAGSEIGVNYELYLNGNPTFSILAGTGTPLDFGAQIIPGTYTVMATHAITGCQSLMTGSTVVSVFINPIATAMSNTPVCEGDVIELFGGGAGCELAANTCNASSTSWFQEHITSVSLNGAVNASTGSTYSDFTGNLLTTLFIGNTYNLSVTNFVDGSFNEYVSVFIDWNRDGDFADAGEAMPIGNFVGTHTFNYSLSVPSGAEVGYTMMRVINQWSSAPSACGTFTYGEVEDYMIEVKSTAGPTCLYAWSGPAGFMSSQQYPTIMPATAANAGVYSVTVTDANGCTASATTTVAINPLPAVSFSGLMPVYCSDDAPALLTGAPAGGTFSGQGISGNTFYPGIAGPGNWDIVYAYTNSFGCENSDTMTVTVNPSPVATVSADTTICQGGTAVVFAGGGSTYLWSNGSTNTAIFVSPLITTTYDVTVTNSFGCTDNASVTVTVNPQPLVNAGGDLEVCLGQSIQLDVTATGAGTVYGYQWTPAVGLSDPSIKNPMASPTATTTYVVLVTSGLGCTASDDVVVTVNPLPNANAGQDMTLCFGTTTTLTATPAGMSYLWSTGQTAQSIVVVAGDTATYFVTVTNSFGCSAVDSVTLASFPLPSAIVSPTQTICEFELAYISATGAGVGGTYSWSSVPPGFSANGPNHIVQPADSTIYYVTVTDLNGCTNINNTIVNVNPKPVVYAGPDQSVCENHTVTLDAGTGFDNYLWSNGVPQQVIQVDSTGVGIGTIIYSVTVTLDGCAAMDEVVVEFMPCPGLDELSAESIEINVFPNPNDGRFTVTVKGFEGSVDLLILNNIGQTVVNERLNHSSNSLFSRDYDLSSFPPGMYFLRFSDGDIVRTRKVIIQ